jgi:tetratricopeptide (TPR) repeat protein/CHAT domain-containing protein
MRFVLALSISLLFANVPLHAQPVEAELAIGKEGLTIEGRIDATDPKLKLDLGGGRSIELSSKSYLVKFPAGKRFKITMRSSDLDSILMAQNKEGRQLAFDDNSSGGQDAEMYAGDPKADVVLRIHAASVKGLGKFTLAIHEFVGLPRPHDPNDTYVVGIGPVILNGLIAQGDAKIKVTTNDGKTGELPAKSYRFKLLGGRSYSFLMRSAAIDSFLIVTDPSGKQIAYDDDSGGNLDAALTLEVKQDGVYGVHAASISKTGPFALVVGERNKNSAPPPNPSSPSEKAYEKAYVVGKDGLTIEGRLAADDAKVKVTLDNGKVIELPAKRYLVNLTGGKQYVLTMRSKSVDSFLLVQDGSDKQLDYDDDSGGGLDSQLTLDAKETVTHRVFAASLERTGPFALTIRLRTPSDPPSLTQQARAELREAAALNAQVIALNRQGQTKKAIPLAQRAVAINKKILGEQHPATAASLGWLGGMLHDQGDFAAARPCFEQAVAICKKVLGEHPATASTLNGLGSVLQAQRDYAAARSCFEQSLAIQKKALGEEHPATANSLNSLGGLLAAQRDYAAARPYYEQALAIRKKVLGEEHPDTAGSLINLGALLQDQGDYATARRYFEQALTIQKKVLGEQHPVTANSLAFLGSLFSDQGDYAAARPYCEQALAIRKNVFGEQHPATAVSLSNLGLLLWRQGDYAAARPCLEQAVETFKKVLGEQHPDTAQSLNNLGILLHAQDDFAAARGHYERALAIQKNVLGDQHPATVVSLNNLGALHQHQGEYAEAQLCYEQALAIRKKAFGEQHPHTAESLNNLGALLRDQGNYPAARIYFEQALAIRKKVLGEQHPETAASLNNLGMMMTYQGDYARARPYLEEALAIRRKVQGEQHPDTASSLSNLGYLLWHQGDHAAARPPLEQAFAIRKKILGEQHRDTAESLNNLGGLLRDQGDYAAARPYLEQALAIRKQVLSVEHPETATSLNNLGMLLRHQGDYSAARRCLEQALAIRKKVLGEQHPDTAVSLNNLGFLPRDQGDYSAARAYYEQALAINQKTLGDQHTITAISLVNVADMFIAEGNHAAARPYYEKALALQRRSLDLAAVGLAERQQLAMNRQLRIYLDATLSASADQPEFVNADYGFVLGWKGAVSARQMQMCALRREPELVPLADRLRTLSGQLAALASAVPNPKKLDVQRGAHVRITQEREDLEVELARKSEAFRNDREQRRVTAADLAASLPTSSILVDFLEYEHQQLDPKRKGYWLRQQRLTAFVIRRDRPIVRVELGPVDKIESAVENWRRPVIGKKPLGDAADNPGPTLRRLVWAPLEKHLAGAKTVLISPDGAIARLPFAALPGKAPGTYLLEDVTIAVLPLPRRLPQMATSTYDGDPSLLLVGDVDYGAAAGKSEVVASLAPTRNGEPNRGFQRLEKTKAEIVAIQKTFAGRFGKAPVTVLEKSAATESAVRKEAAAHRYLHIASHGFFAPPEVLSATAPRERHQIDLFGQGDVRGFHPGLLSGIVLAGANRPPTPGEDDGILTAMEVETIDLAKTELVVLSACETGLGKTAGGEGILGLQRAFQVAGAGSVVASLWSVDDAATQVLMTRFYDNLWTRKMPKAEALREAQLFLLREAPRQGLLRGVPRLDMPETLPEADRRTPPFYWAAFVLSGDWR